MEAVPAELIEETLRSTDDVSNPIWRTYNERGGGFTFSSVVFTLTGKRSIQLAFGSPYHMEYKLYFFSNY